MKFSNNIEEIEALLRQGEEKNCKDMVSIFVKQYNLTREEKLLLKRVRSTIRESDEEAKMVALDFVLRNNVYDKEYVILFILACLRE